MDLQKSNPSSASEREFAEALTSAIRTLAVTVGVKDKERIQLVTKEVFGAAHEERISLRFMAQAVQDYARGKVDGYNSSFFPTPADILRRARYCRDNRADEPDRPSHHDRPVDYPPGIKEQVARIQKKMSSMEYKQAKVAHVMRLRAEGKLPNAHPQQD